mgnify:CR=1 FL=1
MGEALEATDAWQRFVEEGDGARGVVDDARHVVEAHVRVGPLELARELRPAVPVRKGARGPGIALPLRQPEPVAGGVCLVGEAGGDGIVRVRADVFVCVHSDDSNTHDDQQFNGSHSSSRMGCSFLHNSVGWSESKSRVQGQVKHI